jgi:hypothetical protein
MIVVAIGVGAACGAPRPICSQESNGSAAAAVAGGALGMVSGATLATFGSVIPCSQTLPGPTCVRWSAIAGGAIGLSGGVLLGGADSERLGDAALGAGIGFAVGSVAGLLLKSQAQRIGWGDVGTVGLLGASVGSAPLGAAFGLATGGVIGVILWLSVDGYEEPDLVGAAAAGLALGGISEWIVRGIDAQTADSPVLEMMIPLSLGF